MKSRKARLATASTAVVSTIIASLVIASPAYATGGTTLFNQTFTDQVLPSNGAVAYPAAPSGGTNSACLTVAQTGSSPIPECSPASDSSGGGALRLTAAGNTLEGGIFAATSVPASQGLDVTFDSYQYGGSGADGIAFVLAAVDPTNPLSPTAIGQPGGSLGYSATGSSDGLTDGYLGLGLDTFGNFANAGFEGTGCPTVPGFGSKTPGTVVVRGPGNGSVGYCGLSVSASGLALDKTAANGGTRSNSKVPVEVVINTTDSTFTTTNGSAINVPADSYAIVFQPIGTGTWQSVSGPLPKVALTYYGSQTSSWIADSGDGTGYPRQLAFGWVASTGGSTDVHEINSVTVNSINPVPKLNVSQTIQDSATGGGSTTTVPQGNPVTYTVTPSVDSTGASENSPITVTDTLPTGVTPTSASGAGWVCGPPSGQKISCTTTTSGPFNAGTSLPPITVNGVVSDPTGVSEDTIEANSVTTASSPDADPAYTRSAVATAPAAALSGLTISPTSGLAGAAATISGSGLADVSQVNIGSTYLGRCPSGPAAGCFTYDSESGDIGISAMPAHALLGDVTVAVVTGGSLSNTMTFSYVNAPDAPTVTAQAHDDGVVDLSWTPGVDNGSTITSWTVTPYVSGVAGTAVTINDPTTTSHEFTGLDQGTAYTFKVFASTSDAGNGAVGTSNSVTPPETLALTTTSLDAGEVGIAYTETLAATGGTLPYTWSSATLPAGLTLGSTTGVLSGTPTAAFNDTVSFTVTDDEGATSSRDLSLVIVPDPSITTASLPGVVVGRGYSETLVVSGGTGPYTWSVSAGTLPAGLTLDTATGVVSGTPTAVGHTSFSVTVTDAEGQSDTAAVSIAVNPVPPSLPGPPSDATDSRTAAGADPSASTSGAGGSKTFRVAASGSGDLRVSTLAGDPQASANHAAVSGPTSGGFYAVSLVNTSVTDVTVTVSGTPSSSLYWWNGTTWQKVPGVTRAANGTLSVAITGTSSPNIGQLSNALFAAGAVPVARIGGATRIDTAIDVSRQLYPTPGAADAVVLARDDLFADALTGGPFAATKNGPILLTDTKSLLPAVAAEMSRALGGGGTVYLLGGTAALSDSVYNAVSAAGFRAVRIAGSDRFATSVAVANALGNPSAVFEATGLNFPDAVSAGPAAAFKHGAILLTQGSRQGPAVTSYLSANHPSTRYAVGGPAVSADPSAIALMGSDRYATAVQVASKAFSAADTVGFATGADFADALVAAPGLGRTGAPMLLAGATLSPSVVNYLQANADTITSARFYGGTAALPAGLVSQVQINTP